MMAQLRRRIRAASNRAATGCLVLCYHRVSAATDDVWGNAVSPENFEDHIAALAARYPVLSIDELVDAAESGRPSARRTVAITFDDGYAVNVGAATETLVRRRAPATFYLNSAWLGGGSFWWDEIALVTAGKSDAPAARERLRAACKTVGHDERCELIRKAREEAGVIDEVGADCTPMTRGNVAQLAAEPLFTVAAHTHSHPALAQVTAERQRGEIVESKRILEEISGRPVKHFSYPFGGSDDFDDVTIEAVKAAGLRSAATTCPRPVRWPADVYRLPRLSVKNWNAERFASQIDQMWAN
jgi:peptidoglycan/xylan/chitin deacetylase (PgdA/CDA1 family)